MRVRDAVEDDGGALGDLASAPAEVMRNVVHDRTVRVAERESESAERATETDDRDESEMENGERTETDDRDESEETESDTGILGFVGFDAMPGTVRVTYLCGSRDARERLLEEPVRFARKEGMSVEVLVPEHETETTEVVEDAGFERVGSGPRFDGGRTVEYRLDPPGE